MTEAIPLLAELPVSLLYRWQQLILSQQTWLARFPERWREALPQTWSKLIMGLIFGQPLDSYSQIKSQIKIIGMSHIVSASGYNVTMVVGAAQMITSRFYRSLRLCSLCLVTVWYGALCGWSPSISRAVVMSIGLLVARFFHLQVSVWRALLLTVALLTMLHGDWWQNLSFQLSVGATVGICVWLPMWELRHNFGLNTNWDVAVKTNQSTFEKLLRYGGVGFWEALLVTIAAQTGTWPLIFQNFGEWPMMSLIANPLLLGFLPPLTLLSMSAVVFTAVSGALVRQPTDITFGARLIGIPIRFMFGLFLDLVSWLATWPIPVVRITWGNNWSLVYYAFFLLVWLLLRRTYYRSLEVHSRYG